jgi:arsenite methyltransferase
VLLTTLLRELVPAAPFGRQAESDPVMDSEEAVAAFVRAGRPGGILSGVYTFYLEQVCRMIRPGDRVLDLGCGPAQLLTAIATKNRRARFVGIDRSAGMIAAGNASLRAAGLRNVELRIDDMTMLATVEDGGVDVVLSSMALHHLPGTGDLRRCFEAIERVMAHDARMFIADFGRLKSLKSVDYFVRRAIPRNEPILERDYRASLRAAFSKEEFSRALPSCARRRIAIYSTVVSPTMVVLMSAREPARLESVAHGTAGQESASQETAVQETAAHDTAAHEPTEGLLAMLPRPRRADYHQLRLSLRLGGMPLE